MSEKLKKESIPDEKKEKKCKIDRKPENIQPKPKLTKAERRALQEQQRALKAQANGKESGNLENVVPKSAKKENSAVKSKPGQVVQFDDPKRKSKKDTERYTLPVMNSTKNVALFSHLPQYEKRSQGGSLPIYDVVNRQSLAEAKKPLTQIHPSIRRLGLQIVNGIFVGGNARCVAMLSAFKEFILDFQKPKGERLSWVLYSSVNPQIDYLVSCRPLSFSMGNAIRFLKSEIASLKDLEEEGGTSLDERAKEQLLSRIDNYILERILQSTSQIVEYALEKIVDQDVVLTYGYSNAIEQLFLRAHKRGVNFKVIVLDSRPLFEGRTLLKRLNENEICCEYVLINAVSFAMPSVTKVLVGAASMLSNGYVVGRVGTAAVACLARAFNIPFIVCCETYKYSERVQLDSICSNELGDPKTLADGSSILQGWEGKSNLRILNLLYDVTPSSNVSMIVSEVGLLPPTSVPVIIREYRHERQY